MNEWSVMKCQECKTATEVGAQLGSGTFFMTSDGSEKISSLHFFICEVGTIITAAGAYRVLTVYCTK